MGGDNAPACIIAGAELALKRYRGLRFIIYGDAAEIEPLLAAHPRVKEASELVHTDIKIKSADKPSVALRQGKSSSMALAIDAVKQKKACAVVSAGNTGALMALSKIALRMLPGISRPAIATVLPTIRGATVVLDLGANVECSANDLFQFAIMGEAFARSLLEIEHPSIGLLNIGIEEVKGHEEVKAASTMLKNCGLPLNFYGFVEGNDIAEGTVDVVVTDGFSGNIALKTAEGTAALIRHFISDAFRRNWFSRLAALLAYPSIRRVKERLDTRKYNGAMLVGLNGIVIKSHGGADDLAFYTAIRAAVELALHEINGRIVEEIKLSAPYVPTAINSEAAPL